MFRRRGCLPQELASTTALPTTVAASGSGFPVAFCTLSSPFHTLSLCSDPMRFSSPAGGLLIFVKVGGEFFFFIFLKGFYVSDNVRVLRFIPK